MKRLFPGLGCDYCRLALAGLVLPLAAPAQTVQLDPYVVTGQSYVIGDSPSANLSTLEVYDTPGSAGNINLALQFSPGVNFVDEGTALYVQGGDASETRTFVNDVPFPYTKETFTPDGTNSPTISTLYTRQASLFAGDVPVRYGDSTSGVVALESVGQASDASLSVDAGLGGPSILWQDPTSRDNTAVAGASWFTTEAVLKIGVTQIVVQKPSVTNDAFVSDSFDVSGGPSVQIVAYGSRSNGSILATTPGYDGVFSQDLKTDFSSARITGQTGIWQWKVATAAATQSTAQKLGTLDLTVRDSYLYFLAEGERDLSSTASIGVGSTVMDEYGGVSGTVPVTVSAAPNLPATALSYTDHDLQLGAYQSLNWHFAPNWEFAGGLREDAFQGGAPATAIEPRATIAFPVASGMSGELYSGLLAEHATPQQMASALGPLTLTRCWENSCTLRSKEAQLGWVLTLFSKRYGGLDQANASYRTIGGGVGSARGLSAGLKAQLPAHQTLVLNYTLSFSRRTDPDTGTIAASPFDVRDTLAFSDQIKLGGFVLSGAQRYATGKPYTPAIGSTIDPTYQIYNPIYGRPYSSRMPAFWRTDFLVSHRFLIGDHPYSAYVSLINVFNHQNIYAYTYNYDYEQRTERPSIFGRTPYFGIETAF